MLPLVQTLESTARLDRVRWRGGVCFLSYGLRLGIRVNKPEILEPLSRYFPPGWKPARLAAVDRTYSVVIGKARQSLYANQIRLSQTANVEQLFEVLENDLQLYVAEMARRYLFVHAGVVGWRGRAIVIPGQSFSGKSSLVAALLRAGAAYYSDEFAAFDRRGRVHPYPRRLSIRGSLGERPARYQAEELGGRCAVEPLPVGAIVMTHYRAGKRWRPQPLSAGRAMLAILEHTVPARRRPGFALTRLQKVVGEAQLLSGARGEAEEMIGALLDLW